MRTTTIAAMPRGRTVHETDWRKVCPVCLREVHSTADCAKARADLAAVLDKYGRQRTVRIPDRRTPHDHMRGS